MIRSRYLPHIDLDRGPREVEQFGETDVRLTRVLNNLADLYHNQKKYAQAKPLYRRALAIREARLSPTHLLVAQNLSTLATLSRDQDQDCGAEAFIKRCL